jgi:hypothetical protein
MMQHLVERINIIRKVRKSEPNNFLPYSMIGYATIKQLKKTASHF